MFFGVIYHLVYIILVLKTFKDVCEKKYEGIYWSDGTAQRYAPHLCHSLWLTASRIKEYRLSAARYPLLSTKNVLLFLMFNGNQR